MARHAADARPLRSSRCQKPAKLGPVALFARLSLPGPLALCGEELRHPYRLIQRPIRTRTATHQQQHNCSRCTPRHTADSTLTAHLGGGSSAGRSRLCLPATAATLPPCLLAAGLPRQGVCPPLPSALCPSTTTQLHLELAAPCPGRPRSAAAAASWGSLSPCAEPTIFTFIFNRYSHPVTPLEIRRAV